VTSLKIKSITKLSNIESSPVGGWIPGTGFTNIYTIFLSFFYLFSKSLVNCFLIAANSPGPSSDSAGNSFQLKSDSPTFLIPSNLGKHKKKVMDTCNEIVLKTC
jgi:hypothetical protein